VVGPRWQEKGLKGVAGGAAGRVSNTEGAIYSSGEKKKRRGPMQHTKRTRLVQKVKCRRGPSGEGGGKKNLQ